MLMAHPAVLAPLVDEYDALALLGADASTTEVRRRMEDLTYTLCVSTGTSDIDAALIAARRHILGTHPEGDPLLTA